MRRAARMRPTRRPRTAAARIFALHRLSGCAMNRSVSVSLCCGFTLKAGRSRGQFRRDALGHHDRRPVRVQVSGVDEIAAASRKASYTFRDLSFAAPQPRSEIVRCVDHLRSRHESGRLSRQVGCEVLSLRSVRRISAARSPMLIGQSNFSGVMGRSRTRFPVA